MWIVAIAWMYVTLMMALAEATNPQGTVLGAVFTFLMYGLGPLALVLYLMGAPARRKALLQAERDALTRQREQAEQRTQEAREASGQPGHAPGEALDSPAALPASGGAQADGDGLPATAPVASVREETPGR